MFTAIYEFFFGFNVDNDDLLKAIRERNYPLVSKILEDSSLEDFSDAIPTACENDDVKMLELLLTFPRLININHGSQQIRFCRKISPSFVLVLLKAKLSNRNTKELLKQCLIRELLPVIGNIFASGFRFPLWDFYCNCKETREYISRYYLRESEFNVIEFYPHLAELDRNIILTFELCCNSEKINGLLPREIRHLIYNRI